MQTQSVDQLVGQILGKYRLERFLGKGRLNAVYLARHLVSQRTDALALYLIPERFSIDARDLFLMRFRKEAAAITTLDHPHILPVYEYGEYEGYPYLVTPYMTQGSLTDILKRDGHCDHASVLSILEQLVAGITYAHDKGFIHGTLKPANVLLHTEDTMQVAGFGLMHMLQQRGIEPHAQPYTHLLSIADTFLAAPEYIAPEVVQGQAIDRRSDIYSLGCILYELLSGQPPFRGEKPLDIARQHVTQTIPALRQISPTIPAALSAVVHQSLERDPAQRFQSVAELGEAFAQASRGATSYQTQQAGGIDAARRTGSSSSKDTQKETPLTPQTPQEEYTAGNWQLRPPVMTGQVPAIKVPFGGTSARLPRVTAGATDKWQLVPPIVTGRMPALKAPAAKAVPPMGVRPAAAASVPPTLPPVPPHELITQVQPPLPAIATPSRTAPTTPAPVQPITGNSMPGTNADTADLVKAYEWWSLSDQLQTPEAPAAPTVPVAKPVAAPPPQSQKQLPIMDEVDWTAEPLPPEDRPRVRNQKAGPRKVQRRQVFAFIAGGSVIAAGAALFLTLGHTPGTPATQNTQKDAPVATTQKNPPATTTQKSAPTQAAQQMDNKPTAPPQQANNQAPAANGQMTMQNTPAATNGTVIGSVKQMANSSAEFPNPADKKMALLIHLPDNSFVAYERACTHEGVNVNYDPATKMLVCPAHGAIFNPAKGGSVVQGPADQPLPPVHIKVNMDGTITAA
ncbi:MAG: hypothetical protein NVS4B9_02050 [Ktedonobacteraceae bacterium]